MQLSTPICTPQMLLDEASYRPLKSSIASFEMHTPLRILH